MAAEVWECENPEGVAGVEWDSEDGGVSEMDGREWESDANENGEVLETVELEGEEEDGSVTVEGVAGRVAGRVAA